MCGELGLQESDCDYLQSKEITLKYDYMHIMGLTAGHLILHHHSSASDEAGAYPLNSPRMPGSLRNQDE